MVEPKIKITCDWCSATTVYSDLVKARDDGWLTPPSGEYCNNDCLAADNKPTEHIET